MNSRRLTRAPHLHDGNKLSDDLVNGLWRFPITYGPSRWPAKCQSLASSSLINGRVGLRGRQGRSVGLGERTGLLIDAAQDLARRFLRATSRFEGTCSTVTRTRPVEEHVIIHDLAGRGKDLERRANVDITLLGEGEVLA